MRKIINRIKTGDTDLNKATDTYETDEQLFHWISFAAAIGIGAMLIFAFMQTGRITQ